MLPISKSTLGIAAGVGGLLFVGYCIYFDRQRHSDPNFKKKLREKRRQIRQAKILAAKIPDLRTQEAVQRFFLEEIHTGEQLLASGDLEGAVEHLGSAVAVSSHPQHLIQLFQSTLPPQVVHTLLQRMPMIGQNLQARQKEYFGSGAPLTASAGIPGMPPPGAGFRGVVPGGPDGGPPVFLAMDEELELE